MTPAQEIDLGGDALKNLFQNLFLLEGPQTFLSRVFGDQRACDSVVATSPLPLRTAQTLASRFGVQSPEFDVVMQLYSHITGVIDNFTARTPWIRPQFAAHLAAGDIVVQLLSWFPRNSADAEFLLPVSLSDKYLHRGFVRHVLRAALATTDEVGSSAYRESLDRALLLFVDLFYSVYKEDGPDPEWVRAMCTNLFDKCGTPEITGYFSVAWPEMTRSMGMPQQVCLLGQRLAPLLLDGANIETNLDLPILMTLRRSAWPHAITEHLMKQHLSRPRLRGAAEWVRRCWVRDRELSCVTAYKSALAEIEWRISRLGYDSSEAWRYETSPAYGGDLVMLAVRESSHQQVDTTVEMEDVLTHRDAVMELWHIVRATSGDQQAAFDAHMANSGDLLWLLCCWCEQHDDDLVAHIPARLGTPLFIEHLLEVVLAMRPYRPDAVVHADQVMGTVCFVLDRTIVEHRPSLRQIFWRLYATGLIPRDIQYSGREYVEEYDFSAAFLRRAHRVAPEIFGFPDDEDEARFIGSTPMPQLDSSLPLLEGPAHTEMVAPLGRTSNRFDADVVAHLTSLYGA